MSVQSMSLEQIRTTGMEMLVRELGLVGMICFMG